MAFSPLDMPFGALDTKTDERMLPPGALIVAENCSAQLVGGYTKRFGYTQIAGPGTIKRLAAHGNQLLAIGGNVLFGYNGVNGWVSQGYVPEVQSAQENVYLDQTTDSKIGSRATTNGITVHAYNRLSGLYVRLVNTATGAIVYDQRVDFAATAVRCTVANTLVGVFYVTAGPLLRGVTVDTTAMSAGAPVTIASGGTLNAALPVFDAAPVVVPGQATPSTTLAALAWYSGTPNVRTAMVTVSTMAIFSGPNVISADVVDGGIAVCCTSGETGMVLYHSTAAGGMRAACFNPALGTLTVAAFTVEAVTVPAGINCGLVRFDTTHAIATWDRAANGITKQYVQWAQIANVGTVGPLCGPIYNAALASKPFTGDVFSSSQSAALNLWAPYVGQYTYFTVRIPSSNGIPYCLPTAYHAYRNAFAGAQILGQLTDVDLVTPIVGGATSYAFSAPIAYKFLSTATARAGWATFTIDYSAASVMLPVEAIGATYFSSAFGAKTDGSLASDMNFALYPEITQAAIGSVASGGMDPGTYSYKAVFESSDGAGNTDRSTTSLAVTATTVAGAGQGKVTLTVDQLTITRIVNQQGITGNIALFRTSANAVEPLVYRFIGTIQMNLGASSTYTDQAHDSTIASNRLLYTNGGELDHEPPPPSMKFTLHKGRLWGISSADRRVIFYSGKLSPGEGPWFSSAFQIRADAGGDVIDIKSLDDKLVVYKADRCFKIYGNGPNALGQSNDLTEPLLMTSDAGGAEPRSSIATDAGILALSAKGLYLLSRGEEMSYRGENADAYWGGTTKVVAANMIPDRQEIRFELTGGSGPKKVVYNYGTQRWTTHTNYGSQSAVDAIVVGGTYYWAVAGNNVYKEDTTTFLDPGATFVSMKIRTAWVKPAGFQGWSRVQRAMALAQRKTDHQLTLEVENDYVSGTITATKTWTAAQIASLPREQVNLHLVRQKGESYRFTLYDGANGTLGTGEGYAAYGLQLLAQALRGTFEKKLLAAARG